MRTDLQTYLGHIRQLPFVRGLQVKLEQGLAPERADTILQIELPDGTRKNMVVEVKRTNLTYALAQALRNRAERVYPYPLLVTAPKITRGVGQALAHQGINYVDAAGNCRINLEDQYVAVIEGRHPIAKETPRGRGLGAAGYQVLFTILAWPDAAHATLRELARQAGTALGTATTTLRRLEAEGLLLRGHPGVLVHDRQEILERWVHGYQDQVRPKWLIGRYRTPDQDPDNLERRLTQAINTWQPELGWAWGGGAGAMRLTRCFRGPETVLCVKAPPHNLTRELKALPDAKGPLVLLEVPTDLFLAGPEDHVVHPLLLYTQLLAMHDERAREAAAELHDRYLR